MHTFELLHEALALATSMGYSIRHEWLGGGSGGSCEIAGKRWLFVDLSLSPLDQLDQVVRALQADPQLYVGSPAISKPLWEQLRGRRCA